MFLYYLRQLGMIGLVVPPAWNGIDGVFEQDGIPGRDDFCQTPKNVLVEDALEQSAFHRHARPRRAVHGTRCLAVANGCPLALAREPHTGGSVVAVRIVRQCWPEASMIKKLLGNLLRKAGYQAVPTAMLRQVGLELHLKELFATQRIDAVFDVGANRGQFYRLLRDGAQVHGNRAVVRADSRVASRPQRPQSGDPKWHVFPFALGAVEERLNLNVMKLDVFSSFLAPDVDHSGRFRESNRCPAQRAVDVKRLDDIFAALCREYGIRASVSEDGYAGLRHERADGRRNVAGSIRCAADGGIGAGIVQGHAWLEAGGRLPR
jgi:hypothetical protein